MKVTYKKAGVDVRKAEEFVKGIKNHLPCQRLSNIPAFGSLFDLKGIASKYKSPVLVASSDGVGTKLKIAQELNIHNTVGIDLVAMNVNDIVCLGAKPLFFLDYIACGKLKPSVLKEVVRSISEGLRRSDCLLLGGETAEMPGMYGRNEYDLAGFCVGIADKDRIIDGSKMKEGDVAVGLKSNGLHSNGFSLVRKIFSRREIKKHSKELLKPTRIYVKPILSLLRNTQYPVKLRHGAGARRTTIIKGVAHNTGGAFYNKITKILPKGLGFKIYKGAWPVPGIFKLIREKSGLDDEDMYSTFNMGIGMVIVVAKKSLKNIVRVLNNKNVKTYIIGEVVKTRSEKLTLLKGGFKP